MKIAGLGGGRGRGRREDVEEEEEEKNEDGGRGGRKEGTSVGCGWTVGGQVMRTRVKRG